MCSDELKKIALQIVAMLPADRERVECILGLVEDLIEWRGYSDPATPSVLATLSGKEDASPQ